MRRALCILLLLAGMATTLTVHAAEKEKGAASPNPNWSDFRGPSADGVSGLVGVPVEWSETKNVKWKTAIHDKGHSTPVVWGDQIWLTTASSEGHKLYAVCIDKNSGRIIHDILLFKVGKPGRSDKDKGQRRPPRTRAVGERDWSRAQGFHAPSLCVPYLNAI